ncbi:MAG TPA: patatin-like phospholipase family protein [Thiobacillaceae bacterium]|nr:patatin-like phospholipase family protein [Thiobacillaceae bacterium]
MRRWLSLAALALASLASGCAHYVPNQPLERHDAGYGYRFANLAGPEAADDMLVIVTFSGGGTRAAALAYGVLAHLADSEYPRGEDRLRLLDEVDIISSVSGGSFTAAYYALHGERIFDDFEGRFLKRDVQGEITRKILAPVNLVRGTAPKFGRADLAAEFFDEEIFSGATYGDLVASRRRPLILINASDMTLGTRFEFTQEQFDLLCSDLSSFPLARAVAASSAVPIVFSPLTLRNYSGQCGYVPALPSQGLGTRARQVYKAAETRSYLDSNARPYLHLLDGGLTDNTGLRGMLDRVAAHQDPHALAESMGLGHFSRAVLIIVNAETTPDLSLDRSENVPTAAQVFRAIKDIPINRYSFETIELFKASLEGWARQLRARSDGKNGEGFDFYLVEVNFDAIRDPAEREAFRLIPTSFTLPAETVDQLRALGPRLLEESSEYQRLMRDLRGDGHALPERPPDSRLAERRRSRLCRRRLARQHAS